MSCARCARDAIITILLSLPDFLGGSAHTRGRFFWSVWTQIDGAYWIAAHANSPELRRLYPPNWPELSRRVRFERAGGECERCRRPHGMELRHLPDGRWFDPRSATWRDRRGRAARWPDLEDLTRQRTTRIVLAAAHVNHDPARSGRRNLRAWCQACHLAHDRAWHLLQRWISYRLRYARGDCSWACTARAISSRLLAEILARISDRLSDRREPEPPPRFGRDVGGISSRSDRGRGRGSPIGSSPIVSVRSPTTTDKHTRLL